MKTKNKRELEKYWAEQDARKAKLAKKKTAPAEKEKPTEAGEESSGSQSAE